MNENLSKRSLEIIKELSSCSSNSAFDNCELIEQALELRLWQENCDQEKRKVYEEDDAKRLAMVMWAWDFKVYKAPDLKLVKW